MAYPDHHTYATLYARYFQEDRLQALLDGLPFEGNWALDICCGAGRVAFEALKRGAEGVFALDECREMISDEMRENRKIHDMCISTDLVFRRRVCGYVRPRGSEWWYRKVKVAVCQQGVNYWLSRETAEELHAIIEPGGVFAFNTFTTCPSRIPRTMEYELGGRHYWECSYYIGGFVHHVQICNGIPPHVTAFRWLPSRTIHEMLDGLFDVRATESESGKSVIYRCTKE